LQQEVKITDPQEKDMWLVCYSKDHISKCNEILHMPVRKDLPSHNSFKAWPKKFLKTRSVLDQKGSGWPCTSEQNIEQILSTQPYQVNTNCC
jgi:hypothetical protein